MMPPWWTRAAAATLGLAAVLAPSQAVLAAARPVGGQAPGYYRMHVGRFEVTALLDGTHPFPSDRVAIGTTNAKLEGMLRARFLPTRYEGMINAFLVNTGDRLVLIDTGAGELYGKEGGGLPAALRAAGYSTDEVDDIYITHLHEDHAGGLMADGKAVFPKAVVHVSARDADFWLDDAHQKEVNGLLRPFFPAIQKVLAPYIASHRLRPFSDGAHLLPGLRAVAAPGHTPGHSFYLLQDEGQSMLFWGDTVHIEPVQMADPNVAIRYDWDVPKAIATRKAIFARAAAEGWWVAGAHVSFPGIGHVSAKGHSGYAWVPANYTLNRPTP